MSKKETFGSFVRAQREEKRLTLKDVAKVVGVSIVYLSDVETGRRPPFSDSTKLRKLAKALGIESADLREHASIDNKAVELGLDSNPKKSEFALQLARRWDSISDEELERFSAFLEN